MKLVKFEFNGTSGYGVVENNTIYPITGSIFNSYTINRDTQVNLNNVKILPPVNPSKVVAVGLNYRDHAEELGMDLPEEPKLFMKPSTSVIGPEDYIIYPESTHQVDYEAELAAVVGKKAYKVKPEEAPGYILGYTCLNDVTARDLQKKDGQWTRAKSFDTFCPIGPWIETDIDPDNANIYSRLNGQTRQKSNTKNFIFPMYKLFSFISNIMTLLPGDIVTTGTPSGIGPMNPGDTIEVEIEGIGVLKNYVKKPE